MKHEASISCYRIPKGNSLITKIFLSAFQEVNHETEIRRASNAGSAKIASISFYVMYGVCHDLLKAQSFSALFTVFYVFAIRRSRTRGKNQYCCPSLFTGITVLCFFTLRLMNFMTETQTTGTKIFR